MARKKLTRLQREQLRIQFYQEIEEEKLDLAQTLKRMRAILDMDQDAFAQWLKLSLGTVIAIERGIGNPQLDTLQKIGKPFGLEIAFVRPAGRSSNSKREKL